jgi:hypothetical protein
LGIEKRILDCGFLFGGKGYLSAKTSVEFLKKASPHYKIRQNTKPKPIYKKIDGTISL